jgi:hypothetical protein
MPKKIAIMQPTYLPWIGYFALMNEVDQFILLDNVQFEKRSWQQRNKINSNNGEIFLTIPVINHNLRNLCISEVKISTDQNYIKKHINSIKYSYNKSKYFEKYSKEIFRIIEYPHEYLIDLNISLINYFKEILRIDTPLILASSLDTKLKKDSLMYEICEILDASTYIAVEGSRNYLESSNNFKNGKIALDFFDYSHPKYKQSGSNFISHLSVIDLILNHGSHSKDILKSGIN